MLNKAIHSEFFDPKSSPFRGALLSSGVMAFAGLGDAILYPVLPVYADKLGIPLLWVGLLLSINRFVRIVANTRIANIINAMGMKKVLLIASCFAVVTTFFYGLKLGLLVFIIARIIWGLSYSALKISTLNYAAKVKTQSGLIFGLTQSIKSLGALLALWLGPVLIDYWGIQKGLFAIAAISSIAVLLTFFLPKIKYPPTEKVKTRRTFSPSPINLLVGILAIAIDGILVVALANILNSTAQTTAQLLLVVAFYLLLKRLFVAAVSLVSGFLSLKISSLKIFNISVFLCLIALALVAFNITVIGIIMAFFFNAVISTFAPLIAIQQQADSKNPLQAISGVTTWWDLGAGLGAFLGLVLIEKMSQQYLFLILTLLVSILFVKFIIQNAKANRTII